MVHPELGDHEPPRRRADLPPPTAKPFSPGPLVSALRGFIAAGLPPPNPHYLPGGRPPPLADCQCCLDNEAPCDADCTCIEGCPNR